MILELLAFAAMILISATRARRLGYRLHRDVYTGRLHFARRLSPREVMSLPCSAFMSLRPEQRKLLADVWEH
jgi:hypothetical protein